MKKLISKNLTFNLSMSLLKQGMFTRKSILATVYVLWRLVETDFQSVTFILHTLRTNYNTEFCSSTNAGVYSVRVCRLLSLPAGQSPRRAWCQSGSAGRPAACPAGWGWGLESDMSNSIPRTARYASSTLRRQRSVLSTMNAVSLFFLPYEQIDPTNQINNAFNLSQLLHFFFA